MNEPEQKISNEQGIEQSVDPAIVEALNREIGTFPFEVASGLSAAELGGIANAAGFGARFAAKFLKTETFSGSIRLTRRATEVRQALLGMAGATAPLPTSNLPAEELKISGIVGGGVGGMNPVHLSLHLQPQGDGSWALMATATAREGLIKQKSAQGVVERFLAFFAPLAQ